MACLHACCEQWGTISAVLVSRFTISLLCMNVQVLVMEAAASWDVIVVREILTVTHVCQMSTCCTP